MVGHEAGIAAAAVASTVKGLQSMGVSARKTQDALGLSLQVLEDPDGRVPIAQYAQLERQMQELTGEPKVGLKLGLLGTLESSNTGLLGYLTRHSRTMGEAFQLATRYSNLLSDGVHLSLRTFGDSAEFTYDRPNPMHRTIQGVELALVQTVLIFRMVIGDDFYLQKAMFQYAQPDYVGAYQEIFGPRIEFEQPENLVRFPVEYLKQEIPGSQGYLHAILEQRAQEQLAELAQQNTITYLVHKHILSELPSGDVTMDNVAVALNVSRQTLYRQLKAEGQSFQDLLDETRKSLAAVYLCDKTYTITDAAFLLGFSEISAFHRAFKRWYGQTPAAYRNKNMQNRMTESLL